MSALRENVTIKTATEEELKGYLFVGQDGLPELAVEIRLERMTGLSITATVALPPKHDRYRPAQFPAAWELQQAELGDVGILFESWRTILEMQFEIVQTQLDSEEEERRQAREREIENRIAEEIDHSRRR